ncbi:MAG: sulfatase-modifying factor protein [Calditrichaeota bacterium]|nr:MAG: sulfatase-modifying factor protein [Calditrichota bacterium]
MTAEIQSRQGFKHGWRATVLFRNQSSDTVKIANVVPFGQSPEHIYITASGPWALARTKLFRPGLGPVGVILPDNAWELGYSDILLEDSTHISALCRRTDHKNGIKRRWWTLLPPAASVTYTIYVESVRGSWQDALKRVFQERWLYDLEKFDLSLYQRKDLQWIRHEYIIGMQMAWDHEFYDPVKGGYQFGEFLEEGMNLFGGYDIYGLWPTWPRLGIDQRNQWDMYGDIPGGLEKLREISGLARSLGTRFFIAFNPWDQSTRMEDPLKGMARLIEETDADGVVLDTRGSSSKELQEAADRVKPGVVMYSEGMAVPRDMPGIVSGRVHDAIRMPPPLNLNKLIKPDFAIFRVGQLWDGHLKRDISLAFFNGYGMELNTFHPGRPEWRQDMYRYLGKTTRILRENSSNFLVPDWVPLISSRQDSIWINKWPGTNKTLYTMFSLVPEGFSGSLFEIEAGNNTHLVDLWHHEEILPDTIDQKLFASVNLDAFNRQWMNTRREGSAGCVAEFQKILEVKLEYDSLFFASGGGDEIRIWTGDPSYQNVPQTFSSGSYGHSILDLFGRYEGKVVVQLLGKGILLDERVVHIIPGTARLISQPEFTETAETIPDGMIKIPAGSLRVNLTANDESATVRYPQKYREDKSFVVKEFYIDKYPVTNASYREFLEATGYQPEDVLNFLKHWIDGRIPPGLENHPVVNVSLEDARAYCSWAGKRLPTELEWQLAAQGRDGRLWPWGVEFDSAKCNVAISHSTPVDSFPSGASPYGVMDLVGNVWQLTSDVYDNGSYYYVIMRGGSYYDPTSSWWYVKGGPQSLDKHQLMYLVSPVFDRNATVGFRCVQDSR